MRLPLHATALVLGLAAALAACKPAQQQATTPGPATAEPARTATARRKRIREAVVAASDLLGNTPSVARSAYVDPRVLDLYEAGTVLDPVPRGTDAVDRAVAALLTQ